MIAFPIPTPDGVSPLVTVAFAVFATAAFVVIVVQAVRYLRNSGGRHDQFGPPLDEKAPPDDEKPPLDDEKPPLDHEKQNGDV
jgi:hypothetical protein